MPIAMYLRQIEVRAISDFTEAVPGGGPKTLVRAIDTNCWPGLMVRRIGSAPDALR